MNLYLHNVYVFHHLKEWANTDERRKRRLSFITEQIAWFKGQDNFVTHNFDWSIPIQKIILSILIMVRANQNPLHTAFKDNLDRFEKTCKLVKK